MTPNMRYVLLKRDGYLEFVEMPWAYAYQLTALNQRLHKELSKLTANDIPVLPHVVAECDNLEIIDGQYKIINGLDYINELESNFAGVKESSYPLISLLTEIRALQAQLEQWYEEDGLTSE